MEKADSGYMPAVAGLIMGGLLLSYMPLWGIVLAVGSSWLMAYKITSWNRFTPLFKNLNLCKGEMLPTLKERRSTPYSMIYRFSVPPGLGLEDFTKHKDRMQDYLGKDISIKVHSRNVIIEVYNGPMEHFNYESVSIPGAVAFSVGRQRNGKDAVLDMGKGEPHLLVAGQTGGGKSVLLRGIITTLVLLKDVSLYLIDLKGGAEFQVFESSYKVSGFGKTTHEALEILKQVQNEVERRYSLFYNAGAANINEYNAACKEKLLPVVLIIDEYAEFCAGGREEKEAEQLIKSICARARACAIYVIIATQRPDAKVLDGLIKANITNVIGLKAKNRINSEVIIDESGLEDLKGSGHGIMITNGKKVEFQAPFLDVKKARELIQHTYKKPAVLPQTSKGKFEYLR